MTETQKAERRAKRFWVSLVVGLLGLQIVVGGVAVHLAISDQSVAIVPDYHNAALGWDEAHAIRTLSDRMGWQVSVEVSDTVDDSGLRAVRVRILDDAGQQVDELKVVATAFHHTRGDDTQSFVLESAGGGQYQALAPIDRAGIWEFALSFSIGDQTARVVRIVEAG